VTTWNKRWESPPVVFVLELSEPRVKEVEDDSNCGNDCGIAAAHFGVNPAR
jgi:hypothetical protein